MSPVVLAEVVVAVEFDQAVEHGIISAERIALLGVGHVVGMVEKPRARFDMA